MQVLFGNLIDSMFYGLIIQQQQSLYRLRYYFLPAVSVTLPSSMARWWIIALFPHYSYHIYPDWFPVASWRGQEFEFFSPVFNLADASILSWCYRVAHLAKEILSCQASSTAG
jgi:signal peptidase II